MERSGGGLDDLVVKSQDLSYQSKMFYKKSKKMGGFGGMFSAFSGSKNKYANAEAHMDIVTTIPTIGMLSFCLPSL